MLLLRKHLKQTVKLAIPLIIGQLGQMMMGVVDSIMVGHLNAASLAASSLGNGLFMIILVFGMGVTLAISPLVSKAFGAKRYDQCGMILNQGLFVTLLVGVLLTALAVWGSRLIAFMGQDPEVELLAIGYAEILGWSVIPFLLFMTFKQFTEGLNIMVPAMIISLAANIVNAVGNWIFIFGKWGFPALGLEGAGWSTFSTRVIMSCCMILFVISSSRLKKFHIRFNLTKPHWPLIVNILNVGIPSGIQYVFEVSAFVASAFLIGWIGKNELAAHQIALNLASITYMSSLGISMASTVRIARFYGSGDFIQLRMAGNAAFILVLGLMILTGVFFVLANHMLPVLYIDDPIVRDIASQLILLAALFQLSDGQQAVCLGALRGIQDVKIPARLAFVAFWVFGIPIGWFLAVPMKIGVTGVWYGLVVGLTLTAGLLTWRFYHIAKLKSTAPKNQF
ncbi:MAG: MATE family efflux transporter [Acidobacteria bacterium]|nr:MAG: MATE family efflux transporter [Acidobacteriota bacterium]